MLIKVIALIAFIGICQAAEHAYSSQSITHYDSHHGHEQHKHEEPKHEEHKHVEHKHEEPKHEEHKHEEHKHEDKKEHHIEHKVEHKVEHKIEHKVEKPVEHHANVQHKIENHGHIEKLEEKKEVEPKHHEHKVEHKVEHKFEHKIEHKQEHKQEHHEKKKEEHKEHKQEEHKHEQVKIIPVVEKNEEHKITTPVKVVSVPEYVHKGSEEHHDKHHEPATSSQHIARHDVPAPPPKGFSDHSSSAKYEFAYEVKDPHTGDHKYQHEARNGHKVKGVYSLHEADGSVRTVQYAADKHTGFSADVKQTTKHVEEKHH